MTAGIALGAGFLDLERDAQRTFRRVLEAMSRPGRIVQLPPPGSPPGIGSAAAAVLLTLADADTAIWTDAGEAVATWLRFHAGCRVVAQPRDAMFVHAAGAPPSLAMLDAGTAAAPQRAATLLLEVDALREAAGWQLTGPGIETMRLLSVIGAPTWLFGELVANHARYPVGVDVLLCAADRIVALPRSTRVASG